MMSLSLGAGQRKGEDTPRARSVRWRDNQHCLTSRLTSLRIRFSLKTYSGGGEGPGSSTSDVCAPQRLLTDDTRVPHAPVTGP